MMEEEQGEHDRDHATDGNGSAEPWRGAHEADDRL
jgi:hypothetical protein